MTQLVLAHAHTHAGKRCQAGDRIEVDSDLADWLQAIGVAHPDPPPLSTPRRSTHKPLRPHQETIP